MVDAGLRVHGVSGLRVADASVMPKLVGANPNAATVMIGEKAADMINKERINTAVTLSKDFGDRTRILYSKVYVVQRQKKHRQCPVLWFL